VASVNRSILNVGPNKGPNRGDIDLYPTNARKDRAQKMRRMSGGRV
jgi:hypothetical protein